MRRCNAVKKAKRSVKNRVKRNLSKIKKLTKKRNVYNN